MSNTIPTSVAVDELHEALAPLRELLNLAPRSVYADPGFLITSDAIHFALATGEMGEAIRADHNPQGEDAKYVAELSHAIRVEIEYPA